jgi:hypothetical protein
MIFKDNKDCVELASAPKLRPRTKHIGLKYHHFHSYVSSGAIRVQWIDTKHQLADIFTKPLSVSSFEYLHSLLLGWQPFNQRECWYTYVHDTFRYSNHQPRHYFSGAQQLSLLHFSSVFL